MLSREKEGRTFFYLEKFFLEVIFCFTQAVCDDEFVAELKTLLSDSTVMWCCLFCTAVVDDSFFLQLTKDAHLHAGSMVTSMSLKNLFKNPVLPNVKSEVLTITF